MQDNLFENIKRKIPRKTLQNIQDSYSRALGISSIILDRNGEPFTEMSNSLMFANTTYSKFGAQHLINIFKEEKKNQKDKSGPTIAPLTRNVYLFSIPILVGRDVFGHVIGGYVRLSNPNLQACRDEARILNVGFEEYLEMILELPLFTGSRLEESANLIKLVTQLVFTQTIKNKNFKEKELEMDELQEIWEQEIMDKSKTIVKAEKKFEELFNSINDGIYQSNKEGEFAIINKAGANILGYDSAEELIGFPVVKLYKDKTMRKEYLRRIQKTNELKSFIIEMKKKNGEFVYVEDDSKIILDKDNKYNGVEGVFRDVTEEHIRRKEIEESKEEMDKVIDLLPIGIVIVGADAKLKFYNAKAANIFGLNKKQIDDIELENLITISYIDKLHIKKNLIKNGLIDKYTLYTNTIKGDLLNLEISIKPHRYKGEDCYLIALNKLSNPHSINKLILSLTEHSNQKDACQNYITGLSNFINTHNIELLVKEKNNYTYHKLRQNLKDIYNNNAIINVKDISNILKSSNDNYIISDNPLTKNKNKSLNTVVMPLVIGEEIYGYLLITLKLKDPLKNTQVKLISKINKHFIKILAELSTNINNRKQRSFIQSKIKQLYSFTNGK